MLLPPPPLRSSGSHNTPSQSTFVQGGELVGYYADSPLGPWLPHAHYPLIPAAPKGVHGAGRLVEWQGKLHRFGRHHEQAPIGVHFKRDRQ